MHMTTTDDTATDERDSALDLLADCIFDANDAPDPQHDMLDTFAAMRSLLRPNDFIELAARLELCAMHDCDYRICADDNITECAHLR